MKKSILVLVTLAFLASIFAMPQFSAAPNGIGEVANSQGCFCHGLTPSDDTKVTVSGLPETFNASETYAFTVTIQNDVMALDGDGIVTDGSRTVPYGGFRIIASTGTTVTGVDDTLSYEYEGGLTHTVDGNKFRSWDFELTAPADDTKTVELTVYGNAVNGNAGNGGSWEIIGTRSKFPF